MQLITCVLRGHDFKNEVQVAAQVFFHGARFEFFHEAVPQNKFVEKCDVFINPQNDAHRSFIVESFFEDGAAIAVFYKNGEEISRASVPVPADTVEYLNPRRVVILSVYHALQKAIPTPTPWGALTGIRPSKPVRQWLASGCADDEILRRLQDPFCVSEEKARLALAVAHAEMRVESRLRGTGKMPVGVYVSIPFCPTRCVYCSFNLSNKPPSEDFLQQYITAVTAEIREISTRIRENGETVSSYYIGGGTPTFLPEELLEKLLAEIHTNFDTCAEFTVEAGRPDTLTPEKVKILQKYGITRVAVNPQTLNDRTLTAIGRAHTAEDFIKAFHLVREAGFIINTDIIAGLPDETPDDMRRNMDTLAQLSPENITIHTLAIKRASRLAAGITVDMRCAPTRRLEAVSALAPQVLNCEHHNIEAMLQIAADSCAAIGLSPYYLYRQKNMAALLENIGYAAPGTECLYNIGMMAEVQTIHAAGAGAVSKFIDGDKITRKFNPKDPAIYISRQKGESTCKHQEAPKTSTAKT